MRIIQFVDANKTTAVGKVIDATRVQKLNHFSSIFELARAAIAAGKKLTNVIEENLSSDLIDYQSLIDQKKILPPITHPDPAHLMVSGTGLTHLGSADARATMHAKLQNADASATDTMKMFKMGVEGGKPKAGEEGVQPEWFYKGDGHCLFAPESDFAIPGFALDGGEEPEIAGVYVIGFDGQPYRIGYALGNEFSDHVMERINYLYLAHSKLRACAIGPELYVGDLPASVVGTSRIWRDGKILWQKEFLSGEENMSHSIKNLEAHHFKYQNFLQPNSVHVHFFGTGTLSFADGVLTQDGDIFEVESEFFGRPLRNGRRTLGKSKVDVKTL